MKFFKRPRIYESSVGRSEHIWEIMPKNVTVKKDINPVCFNATSEGYTETPFVEVSIVPYESAYPDIIEDFNFDGLVKLDINYDRFIELLYEQLVKVIEQTWDSSKFHVIPHSSGNDTRLISYIIKQLYDKNGKEWLGDILFVEANGEQKEFLEIMKLVGWDKSQYMIYNEGAEPSKYHNHSFNFDTCWKSLNGYMSYPMNKWYDFVDYLQHQGTIPEDDKLQLYTGYGANETTRAIHDRGQSLEWYYWWHYHIALSQITYKGNWVHPFWELDFLHLMEIYGWKYLDKAGEKGKSPLSVSKLILDKIAPEFKEIKNLTTNDVAERGFLEISDEMMYREMKNYGESWYGKNNKVKMPVYKVIMHCEWWGKWALASFCEYLIKEGHNVEMEC